MLSISSTNPGGESGCKSSSSSISKVLEPVFNLGAKPCYSPHCTTLAKSSSFFFGAFAMKSWSCKFTFWQISATKGWTEYCSKRLENSSEFVILGNPSRSAALGFQYPFTLAINELWSLSFHQTGSLRSFMWPLPCLFCGKCNTYPMIQWRRSAPNEHALNEFSNEFWRLRGKLFL